ncbi:formylglycine-generating enzyme family protein [Vannielia litorea]|uniref:Formylglycine-generating enzyme, required for sulfatase activity, contains SUMF1/FGE domain n=1 Tax=Vannielia litorea TaxID=1217970 RepID=A0A1N6E3D8_9RHOB|nr:formylglycine-generating enzyme family protein [Vannielia litorea]SIN77540.1 Formylglycine-generating enzyme, required for sulfatase activity, contains SUMF1/FGE domain [Vannielia litorea]
MPDQADAGNAGKEKSGCCPSTGPRMDGRADYLALAEDVAPADPSTRDRLRAALIDLPGGIFEMGTRKSTFAADLDSPRRKVKLSPFAISPHSVTVARFRAFVEATGYVSVAEHEGWSYVFHLLLPDPAAWPNSPPGLRWWRQVNGATWFAPEGPGSTTRGREEHPVTHISWYDARAYARWSGLRLPREAEWEFAARGGLARQKFPWGNAFEPSGKPAMNTFRGQFPDRHDLGPDWQGTVPVTAHAPNGYGLYNMTGNVWEWVEDRFGPLPPAQAIPPRDPGGAAEGYARVQRGGSYLCHVSYCDRYHVHSRTRTDPDTSIGNCGFRVAAGGAAPVVC